MAVGVDKIPGESAVKRVSGSAATVQVFGHLFGPLHPIFAVIRWGIPNIAIGPIVPVVP